MIWEIVPIMLIQTKNMRKAFEELSSETRSDWTRLEIRFDNPIILMPLIWSSVEDVVETRFCTLAFHAILAGPIPCAALPVAKLDTGSVFVQFRAVGHRIRA